MCSEKVEKIALKDTQHILKLTVEMVLSGRWMHSEVMNWLVVLRFLLQLSLCS